MKSMSEQEDNKVQGPQVRVKGRLQGTVGTQRWSDYDVWPATSNPKGTSVNDYSRDNARGSGQTPRELGQKRTSRKGPA